VKSVSTALLVAFLAALSACGAGGNSQKSATLQTEVLQIVTPTGKRHQFTIEVARTSDEQARGLMFRESLAPFGGMIFPMQPPRPASFWMKNTVIPLDMIFIRADGTIARIAAETIPYSLDTVVSGEPVAAVLEIAGGRVAALNISEDDKVIWDNLGK
jgi:uncharacterized protein